tara:strand:+ start:1082 stop:1261 length:180 start_codon:yes stop_codon:yes gene_type:complete
MPIAVVDPLEVIEIDQDQRKRLICALGTLLLVLQFRYQLIPVPQLRKRIPGDALEHVCV